MKRIKASCPICGDHNPNYRFDDRPKKRQLQLTCCRCGAEWHVFTLEERKKRKRKV